MVFCASTRVIIERVLVWNAQVWNHQSAAVPAVGPPLSRGRLWGRIAHGKCRWRASIHLVRTKSVVRTMTRNEG